MACNANIPVDVHSSVDKPIYTGTIKHRIRLKRLNEQAFLFLHSLTLPCTTTPAPPPMSRRSPSIADNFQFVVKQQKNRDLNQK